MAYKHILVAIDLSEESHVLIEKAVSIAAPYQAKVSLIHVDLNYSDLYTGFIDINMGDMQQRISDETQNALQEFATSANYPISELLTAKGDLATVLTEVINKYNVDLVICGHHQDFWSKLVSSAKQLLNSIKINMLIVPLREPEDSES